jgi:hypothetical protein
MNAFSFCATACLCATAAFGQQLNWAELARRPDLWPAQCGAKQEMKFDGGVVVRAGQTLTVLKVMSTEAQVETLDTHTAFTVAPDEVDLLGIARAAYARLTPSQRALSYEALTRQKELWPLQVTLKKTFDMGGGKIVREGEQFGVVNILSDRLVLKSEIFKATFQVVPQATDLMALGRALVENREAVPRFVDAPAPASPPAAPAIAEQKKPSFGPVIAELEPELISSATGKPAPLDEKALPKYIVLFRGSSTCPITRQFTPTLIKYYQQMKPTHPEFEIVYLMTETVENTNTFAKELGFSWRAIRYDHAHPMPTVMRPIQGLLPQLIVMDRNGRVLANGWQNSAPNALKQLDALLKMPLQNPR